jgi:peptide/nickel transport system substrate-binding protein
MIIYRRYRALGLSIGLLLLAACATDQENGNNITYGLTLSPTGIDPHINSSVELGIPLSSVYDTLVFHDPDTGEYVPGLAERWELSPDGRSYTFYLREDVTFHDGEHFDAQAVKANLEYVLDPDHRSQKAAGMLGPLQEIEILGSYIVVVHLERPFAPLLDSLSQVYLGMASPRALEAHGPSEYQFQQVGTGPYRFVEYLPNDHLTLVRNNDYAWAPSIYRSSQAEIESITFLFFEDPATRALALENGRVDIIGELPPHEATRISELPEYQIVPVQIPGEPLQFIYNTRRSPTDELLVRRALTSGVDRQMIVDTVFGGYSPVASGPLASATLGASEEIDIAPYDPTFSEALLEDAGWSRTSSDQIRSRGGLQLKIELVVPPWGSNPEVAQLVVGYWETLGVDVSLEVAPGFGLLAQTQAEGDYHAIGFNSFGSDPDLLRPFYESTGFFNWSGHQDPGLDDLLASAAAETSSFGRRLDLYRQIQQEINEQYLILPVRDYVNLVGYSQRIEGLRFSTQGWFPYLIELTLSP